MRSVVSRNKQLAGALQLKTHMVWAFASFCVWGVVGVIPLPFLRESVKTCSAPKESFEMLQVPIDED